MAVEKEIRRPFSLNEFEGRILRIVLLSAGLPVLLVVGFFYCMFSDLIYTYLNTGLAQHFLDQFFILSLLLIMGYFLLVALLAYRFAHHLVGAFPRILREIDGCIAGKSKKHIHVRKDDYGKELVDRVNQLIDKIP